MKYNFDTVIERRGTSSVKWDLLEKLYGSNDLLSLWVADMDFHSPEPIIKAVQERAEHGIYGYTACMEGYYTAIMNWFKSVHNWSIDRNWIIPCIGVVPALAMILRAFTEPGDKVLIQQPVYYPFMKIVEKNSRIKNNSSLILRENRYYMDFEDLGKKLSDPLTRLMFLCSPHNPGGRVWTKEELITCAKLCQENGVILVTDEIHCDLVFKDNSFTPLLALNDSYEEFVISCTAPSKTFNLAGLQVANCIIPNPKLRHGVKAEIERSGMMEINAFGTIACEAAYNHGQDWLGQVLEYIEGNINFLIEYLADRVPHIKVMRPEATYLVWLDFSEYGLSQPELVGRITNQAKLALSDGTVFGEEGEGFIRINTACPRSTLQEALKALAEIFSVV